jgi:hypothetical protein
LSGNLVALLRTFSCMLGGNLTSLSLLR